jgi:hypothetical protein
MYQNSAEERESTRKQKKGAKKKAGKTKKCYKKDSEIARGGDHATARSAF